MDVNPTFVYDGGTDVASIFILCDHVFWDALEIGDTIFSLFVIAAVQGESAQVRSVSLGTFFTWLVSWLELIMTTSWLTLGGTFFVFLEGVLDGIVIGYE